MCEIFTINNLSGTKSDILENYSLLGEKIAILVNENMKFSNQNTYSEEDFIELTKNKTIEAMINLINKSFLVYMLNDNQDLIGCGMVTYQDNRYFYKTLHVHANYRGLGYANKICDLRDEFLKSIQIKEVFIESLKYPKTLEFHKKRGFFDTPNYRELRYTILMKKYL